MSSYSWPGCQSAAGRMVRSSTPMRLHTISRLDLWLDVAARERPEGAAVNGVSYGEMQARADALALELLDKGVGPGDRVATTLSGLDFAVLLHAVPRIGAVLVPLNTRLTEGERQALLDSAQPSLVLDHPVEIDKTGAIRTFRQSHRDPDDVFVV